MTSLKPAELYPAEREVPLSALDTGSTGRHSNLEQVLAGLALVIIAQRFAAGPGIMPRHFIILILLPLWVVCLARFRGGRLLLVLGIAATVAGAILARLSAATHTVSQYQTINTSLVLIGVVCGVGVVLWTRTILTLRQVGLWFGAGMLISTLQSTGTLGAGNPLKFGWAIPIAVFVLSAVNDPLKRGRQLLVLLLLAILSIASDARALFAVCILAAVLVAWQLRPTVMSRTKSWTWTAALIGAMGFAVYNLATTLLVNGLLGTDAQARSVQQLGSAGSLILGGRPELAATAALFLRHPFGFGAGVSVSHGDLLLAKAGMAAINYDPDNGYVETYMFGSGGIELHSNVGDLWAAFGLLGIALMALMAVQVIRNISTEIAHRQASAVSLFLACWSLWNVAFSPFFSSAVTWIITLGLLLPYHPHGVSHIKRFFKRDEFATPDLAVLSSR